MPIRINLLAEAQALEELRRKDPVKRVIWAAAGLVFVILAWSSSLQVKAMFAKSELNHVNAQLGARTNEFQQVLANQNKLVLANRKLSSLQQMVTNRLLHGTLLNALQQTTIEDVQLVRLRTDESYIFNEEVKPKTNSNDRVIPGRPASVTEKILVTLDARDYGVNPGDQVNKFKHTISESPYFQSALSKTNEVRLTNLSPPHSMDGKSFVLFTVECRFPDKTR
jgi:Flp pilus assembly CpaF family ATPase